MPFDSVAEPSPVTRPQSREARVCAVVVTYHPSPSILQNIRKAAVEFDGLVVVDNGSHTHELSPLRTLSRELGFELVENAANVGIAEAMNQGVRWAKSQNYGWALLFDQDSGTSTGFVDAMLKAWHVHPQREKIACVYPRYAHPLLGYTQLAPAATDGSTMWCMTSGALMPIWVFDRIGWFASDFFIDWVDVEYCFRMRKAGYLIIEAPEAVLLHDPGRSAPASFLGWRFWPSHHSAARRYYMSRNRVVVLRKYFFTFPLCTAKAMYIGLRDTAKCFLGETDRLQKLRSVFLGTWDGLIGNMGMRIHP